jgi:hypothetical protein
LANLRLWEREVQKERSPMESGRYEEVLEEREDEGHMDLAKYIESLVPILGGFDHKSKKVASVQQNNTPRSKKPA